MRHKAAPQQKINYLCTLFAFAILNATAQQVPDTLYSPHLFEVIPKKNAGSVVYIDEAHYNFHTAANRYRPFARLLTKYGLRVESFTKEFTEASLANIRTLVIANAISEANSNDWRLPNPSAFGKKEIDALNKWVSAGGSLFLIADHMPFAGAAADLAASFGFKLYNGFAIDTTSRSNGDTFTKAGNGIFESSITQGLDSLTTFTGQAFEIPEKAISLITFNKKFTLLMPEEAWVFDKKTIKIPASGKSQLAALPYGKGKLVVSGEAAMFTAQLANGNKVGMNSAKAKNNYLLLIRLMDWLVN